MCKQKIQNHATITHLSAPTTSLNMLSTASGIHDMFTGNGNAINIEKAWRMQLNHTDVNHEPRSSVNITMDSIDQMVDFMIIKIFFVGRIMK